MKMTQQTTDGLDEPVRDAVSRLDILSLRIRLLAASIPFLTIATLIFGLILPGMRTAFPITIAYFDSIFFASISLVTVLLVSTIVEFLIKRGNIIFQEISDELQWKLDSSTHYGNPGVDRRPSLNIRISLRNFVSSGNLPFYRGANGILFYLLLNLILWFSGILVGIVAHSMRY